MRLGARTYDDAARLVMGVVNATPDSFSGGARAHGLQPALEQLAEMVADGADVIDVGGVKAGLGPEVTPAQEIARIETEVGSVRRGTRTSRSASTPGAPRWPAPCCRRAPTS